MTTYLTIFSRSLTSYSYIIGSIMKKLFSRTHLSNTNDYRLSIVEGYGSHCGDE